jgi:hypothetical protein
MAQHCACGQLQGRVLSTARPKVSGGGCVDLMAHGATRQALVQLWLGPPLGPGCLLEGPPEDWPVLRLPIMAQ